VLSRLSRGATISLGVTLLAPASANAFKPTGVTAAPADAQAGANSNFSMHFKGFVSNPTSCAVATTTIDAIATQESGSAAFTATGCDKLAFAPTISATVNPGNAQIGTAKAETPALPAPLAGP
jgi:hypothetical protein